jgi:hypothetical protein
MQYLDGSLSKTYTPIPAAYTGANDLLSMRTRGQVIVLVNYTKGSEPGLELIVEISPDPTGATSFYQTVEMTSSGLSFDVGPVSYVFAVTGLYQLPIPTVMRAQRMRLQVRGTGGVAGNGTAIMRVIDDSAFGTDPLLNPPLGP